VLTLIFIHKRNLPLALNITESGGNAKRELFSVYEKMKCDTKLFFCTALDESIEGFSFLINNTHLLNEKDSLASYMLNLRRHRHVSI
jgi:hypothetical protein